MTMRAIVFRQFIPITLSDNFHAVVATREFSENGSYWEFTDGSKYDFGPLILDNSHRFFVSGKDLGKGYRGYVPYLFRVSEPAKPLGRCSINPRKIFCDGNILYLVHGGDKKKFPAQCEIVDVADNQYKTVEIIDISLPAVWAASHLFPEDFDPVTKRILFRLVKHDKFTSRPQYIYDLNTRQLKKNDDGKNSDGIFLQRDFFDRVFEILNRNKQKTDI